MKVISLKSENFLRLRAVEITPSGGVVKVSGANGQGKTSVLDSIWAVLDHSKLNAEEPVRRGAKKAVIKLNMGEFTAQRTITGKSTELTITAADGTKVASPQKFLDSLIGELSFDPLAFDRMSPRDQVDQLRRLVHLDFSQIDKQNEIDYAKRTEVNRMAKAKRVEAEVLPIPHSGALQQVDEKPILEKINKAGEQNALLEKRKAKRADLKRSADAAEEVARNARKRIEELTAEAEAREAEVKEARERLAEAPPLPDPVDVTLLTNELLAVQRHNAAVKDAGRRIELEAEAEKLEAEALALTEAIEGRTLAKADMVAAADMPVPGLGFGDGTVMYGGLPYAQASAAERLRVSMAIAMKANPKIRVIRIADGSLLDSKSMAVVGELAKANDFQVWVEVVDESRKIGIVIEDGAVAAVNE